MLKDHEIGYIYNHGGGKTITHMPQRMVYCDFARQTVRVVIKIDKKFNSNKTFCVEPDQQKEMMSFGRAKKYMWIRRYER